MKTQLVISSAVDLLEDKGVLSLGVKRGDSTNTELTEDLDDDVELDSPMLSGQHSERLSQKYDSEPKEPKSNNTQSSNKKKQEPKNNKVRRADRKITKSGSSSTRN